MNITLSLRKPIVFLIAGSFLGGAIAGGGINELRHRSAQAAQAADPVLFAAKLRCQQIGEKYEADNREKTLLKVDYSPASHSCIAELEVSREAHMNADSHAYGILDLVTNDLYGGELCLNAKDCEEQKTIHKAETLFHRVVAGKVHPIG